MADDIESFEGQIDRAARELAEKFKNVDPSQAGELSPQLVKETAMGLIEAEKQTLAKVYRFAREKTGPELELLRHSEGIDMNVSTNKYSGADTLGVSLEGLAISEDLPDIKYVYVWFSDKDSKGWIDWTSEELSWPKGRVLMAIEGLDIQSDRIRHYEEEEGFKGPGTTKTVVFGIEDSGRVDKYVSLRQQNENGRGGGPQITLPLIKTDFELVQSVLAALDKKVSEVASRDNSKN